MVFPDLGNMKDWVLVGHGDAGIKSMPDKITSVGGHVVMMVNKETSKTCVLGWRSRMLKRKVISSLAGEALAMAGTIGEIVYMKAILSQILGKRMDKVPVIIVTDSKNLEEAVYSTKLVEDPWLIPDIAIIKEAREQGTVAEVKRVSREDMLAKQGASAEGLLTVMMTLYLRLPPAPTGTITLGGDTDDERRIHHSSLGGERKKGCIGHMYIKMLLSFFPGI